MKKTTLFLSAAILLGIGINTRQAFAADYTTDGTINYKAGSAVIPPVDPTNPDPTNPVDPVDPPQPGTGGALSIDYASKINFDTQEITSIDKTYNAKLDQMKDGSEKPLYVQVTDQTGTLAGWNLTAKQNAQFKTTDGDELTGAVLKLSKASVASNVDKKYTPGTVATDVTLKPDGSQLPGITAAKGQGAGTWVYRFGDTNTNAADAVTLAVPGSTVKLAKEYKTTITWTLQSTPTNP